MNTGVSGAPSCRPHDHQPQFMNRGGAPGLGGELPLGQEHINKLSLLEGNTPPLNKLGLIRMLSRETVKLGAGNMWGQHYSQNAMGIIFLGVDDYGVEVGRQGRHSRG